MLLILSDGARSTLLKIAMVFLWCLCAKRSLELYFVSDISITSPILDVFYLFPFLHFLELVWINLLTRNVV